MLSHETYVKLTKGMFLMGQNGFAFRSARTLLARLGAIDVAVLYLGLGLLGVIPLAFLTPPFQVPDEPEHFFRAYQLSELNVQIAKKSGMVGAELPSSLIELEERFLGTRDLLESKRLVTPSPLNKTLEALTIPLEPEQREFINFFVVAWSPLPYIPQAIAIFMGRMAGFGPLGLLYAARIFNGLTALLIVTAAVWMMPAGRWLLFIFGLLPMVLYEFASVTPDASIISTAFLFTAVAMRARFRGHWNGMDVGVGCLAGMVFCSVKPVYMPLLVIGLPAILRRGSARHIIIAHAILIGVVLSVTAFWHHYSDPFLVHPIEGTNPMAQLVGVVSHPGQFAATLAQTFRENGLLYFHSMIGGFGWLRIRLPDFMYQMPIIALLIGMSTLSQAKEQPRMGPAEAIWQLILLGLSSLLLLLALYLYATPIGDDVIERVQGRHFLPLAGLAAMILSAIPSPLRIRESLCKFLMFLLAAVEVLLTPVIVILAYQVF